MKLARLVIVVFAALTLSAPATATISPDSDVYANLSAITSIVTELR